MRSKQNERISLPLPSSWLSLMHATNSTCSRLRVVFFLFTRSLRNQRDTTAMPRTLSSRGKETHLPSNWVESCDVAVRKHSPHRRGNSNANLSLVRWVSVRRDWREYERVSWAGSIWLNWSISSTEQWRAAFSIWKKKAKTQQRKILILFFDPSEAFLFQKICDPLFVFAVDENMPFDFVDLREDR